MLRGLWKNSTLRNLLLLGFFLRLFFLYEAVHQVGLEDVALISSDSRWYVNSAESIINSDISFEKGLFTFGPGYAMFIAIGLLIWGKTYLLFILSNVLLSTLSIALVYLFAIWLTGNRSVALLAGLLNTISYTSITLSLPILSDTLFFSLFGTGLLFLIRSLDTLSYRDSILTGAVVGISALCRAIGQGWPFMIILIYGSFVWTSRKKSQLSQDPGQRWRPMRCLVITLIVSLIPIGIWTVRNYSKHDAFTLSLSGVQGFAKTVALAVTDGNSTQYREIISDWIVFYREKTGKESLTSGEQYAALKTGALDTFNKNRIQVLSFWAKQILNNVTDISYFHRSLVPEFNSVTIKTEEWIKKYRFNYISLVLCLAGLAILLAQRQYFITTFTFTICAYFALLGALTPFQGSRVYYPSQYASALLAATTLLWLFNNARHYWKKLHIRFRR